MRESNSLKHNRLNWQLLGIEYFLSDKEISKRFSGEDGG
jgi:hypothetical protein